ncbi:MAG: Lrp/AsnC ligand binding domain-containing protein [Spirochaetales bacterium]|nr:Lrp/AsnC ligand binding domain-containing protein [Spirochaetales bacterium]
MNYELDNIDRQILAELTVDARVSFQDIARRLVVSGGTVHVRVHKMREAGLIKGFKVVIDPEKLGYDVCAFIGINLHNAGDYTVVMEKLKTFTEITEIHYTTGTYSIFVKILAATTRGLHHFLVDKLQKISEIQSTETFMSLDRPVEGKLPLGDL